MMHITKLPEVAALAQEYEEFQKFKEKAIRANLVVLAIGTADEDGCSIPNDLIYEFLAKIEEKITERLTLLGVVVGPLAGPT